MGPLLDELGRAKYIGTVGELNYAITSLCLRFMPSKPHYVDYNDVIGVLENVKLEFYRRRVAPYEERKLQENGDV